MTMEDIQPYCNNHGYSVSKIFNQIHIKTKYERWYFEECDDPNCKVRLMHCNRMGDGWHEQFRSHITAEKLVTYIHEHETGKFVRFTNFHMGKTGGEQNLNEYVFQNFSKLKIK